mgnify:CR=1 FL=1
MATINPFQGPINYAVDVQSPFEAVLSGFKIGAAGAEAQAKAQALEQAKSIEAHYAHLIIHGALHLYGYDHENKKDADMMEAKEIKILSGLGFKNPYLIEESKSR